MKYQFFIGLLIISLATCSVNTPAPTDSGIEGQALIGSMCPVVQEGQECPDQPYQATLTVLSQTGREIAQVQADSDGRFKIPLAAGTYILHPESPNAMPFASDQTVVVQAGTFTHVVVTYDSGIR